MHHQKRNGTRSGVTQAYPARRSLTALAAALAIASALTAGNAWALALGRVSVQSVLGEPLRAEIDVPSITETEVMSLQLGVAPPERFQAANMEFNPLLAEVRFELVQRPDGRFFIRLSSDRIVSEPFLDMVVQAQWANGQLLRGYTLLFDPPNLRAAPAPLLAAVPPPAPVVTQVRPAAPVAAPVAAPAPAAAAQATPDRVQVHRGDTASGIVLSHMPAGASLDQMLIALLRANPNAFMGGNVNRLRAGAILDLPDTATASAIPVGEARQLVRAQSRDFNEFRRRLAEMAQVQETPAATRRAEGAVQADIADQQAAAAAQDRLTLAQAGGAAAPAEQAAQALQKEAVQQRTDELNRNLQELERLRQAAATAPPQEAPPPAPPATEVPAAPGVTAPVSVPAEPPPAPAPAPTPAPAPVAAPQAESFVQSLTAHPYALPAGGGLVALLALLGLLRWRKRQQAQALSDEQESDGMADEQAQGQTVDTSVEAPVSSMMYSPSQLDAGGDVDPVAEADVYLAYGRDKQAEEILLEALRLHPDRIPVRLKLLELYAQRNDVDAFNATAQDVHALTGGTGPDWQQARAAGLRVDPDNPLYISAGPSASASGPVSAPPDIDLNFDQVPEPSRSEDDELDALLRSEPTPAGARVDLDTSAGASSTVDKDLDLIDFDLDTGTDSQASTAAKPQPDRDSELDFVLDLSEIDAPKAAAPAAATDLPDDIKELSLDLDDNLAGNDPLETKLSLAEEFHAIGDTEGARSLAEEVESQASGALKERARAFLARIA